MVPFVYSATVREEEEGSKHPCPVIGCDYTATQSGHIKVHMRVHTGERPFACPVIGCDYTATTSGSIKRHLRVHTD